MVDQSAVMEDISLRFECPTCGAGLHEKCLSHRGIDRCESHPERLDAAVSLPKLIRSLPSPISVRLQIRIELAKPASFAA